MMRLPDRDIHSHLLPGVDDGFQNSEDSLKAIERMSQAGCREFVFTPHLNPDVYPEVNEARHREVYEKFKSEISTDLNVSTTLAAEYMIVQGFEEKISSRADELLTYPDRSILVEMSYYFRSMNLEQVIFELNMADLKPVLAHPERYAYMAERLSDFDRIIESGCRLQMNLMSLTGRYGQESMKILEYLLSRGMYSFVATDLHSLQQLEMMLSYKPGLFLRHKLKKTKSELLSGIIY